MLCGIIFATSREGENISLRAALGLILNQKPEGARLCPEVKMPGVVVVYGNHGDSPFWLDDYFELLEDAFGSLDIKVDFSVDIVPNKLNILIECFDKDFVKNFKQIKQSFPQTRFVCVCTEFVTNNTFNHFHGRNYDENTIQRLYRMSARTRSRISRALTLLTPPIIWRLISKPFLKFKDFVVRSILQIERQQYIGDDYFYRRFVNFSEVARQCEQLWCVSEHQLQGYQERFAEEKVRYFPITTFKATSHLEQNDSDKDIDILFTGTVTKRREAVINELKSKGMNVKTGFWHSHMWDHYVKRTKVCLHIKQTDSWAYPSNMRLHKLLMAGSVVVSESCSKTCEQESFLATAPLDELVKTCEEALESGHYSDKGREARLSYFNGSENERRLLLSHIRELVPATPLKNGAYIEKESQVGHHP